jgi:DNA gyrase subunit A
MGRGTAGVRGMNVSQKDNRVLSLTVARDDSDLLVVTENGFGKRTAVSEYPIKNRGTKGVLTIKLTETKGGLAGALIVREHQELMFITENGMVQRTSAGGISKTGRATQGVTVMNVKDGDRISAVALVVEAATNGDGEGIGSEDAPEQPELEAGEAVEGDVESSEEADE